MSVLTQHLVTAAAQSAVQAQPCFSGRVSRFDGHMIECDGFPATIGTLCQIETQEGGHIIAEVIGFQNNNNLLCVHETGARISVGARVTVHDDGYMIRLVTRCWAACLTVWAIPLTAAPPIRWRKAGLWMG